MILGCVCVWGGGGDPWIGGGGGGDPWAYVKIVLQNREQVNFQGQIAILP